MDQAAQKMLDEVLAKEPSELTDNDKALLRARWHYVGKNSRQKFAGVLDEIGTKPEPPVDDSKDIEKKEKKEKKNNPSTHPADQDADEQDEEDSADGDQDTDEE